MKLHALCVWVGGIQVEPDFKGKEIMLFNYSAVTIFMNMGCC